jgi:hypothetical protein
MSVITVRVPEELKGCMKRCKSVNWSEVSRKAFEEVARKVEMQSAAESIKTLRMQSTAEWNGAKVREWRDAGSSTWDSSVVVKWFSTETKSLEALDLLD